MELVSFITFKNYHLFIIYTDKAFLFKAKKNNTPVKSLLKEKKYDLLISPGLTNGLFINDLIIESERLNIPLIYIMNSWDNPSTAPFAAGWADLFLAWGGTDCKSCKYLSENSKE